MTPSSRGVTDSDGKNRRKTTKRSNKGNRRCMNYLPEHIGSAFQKELIHLVDELAKTGGVKEKYLQSELLSKYCDSSTTPPNVRSKAALDKWLLVERQNTKSNMRIMIDDADFGYGVSSRKILSFARGIIAKTLGEWYPEILAGSSHSNGASTRVRRGVVASSYKLTGTAHVSTSALAFWQTISASTRLEDQEVAIQESSVFFTVPKSSDIDRVACKEPEINMFLQRSIGNHIRRRLKRFGINLNDQSINQSLARDALHLNLATIDLSSASDTITSQLVFELLPFEWWSVLDDIRVKSTILPDGTVHDLSMFSSMGNGFTFELESLIFWALTRSICYLTKTRGQVSVYGDDIICPAKIAPFLAQIFGWFGFKVNSKKSNWTGLFRESCGKHYYNSWDISPFYIREPVKSKTGLIRLLNRLLYWDGRGFGCIITPEVLSFHMKWSQSVPECLWGGIHCESIDALVTGHSPRKRLHRLSKDMERPDAGAINHWFCVKEGQFESRLSYDIGQWIYPPMAVWYREGKDLPFSVENKASTRYVYTPNTVFKDKETARLYGESTAWDPWLTS